MSLPVSRQFVRHYLEMVVVMLVGMAVLALPAQWVTGDGDAVMLGRMAVIMALPMVPWMRWRGHGWAPCLEMAAAMLVPGAGAIALLESGAVTDSGALMAIEHTVMFAAMAGVMLARPEEYSACHPS